MTGNDSQIRFPELMLLHEPLFCGFSRENNVKKMLPLLLHDHGK